MIRGLMTAATGILANEKQQEIIANNIANAETPGFKSDDGIQGTFEEMLLYRMNDHSASGPVLNTNERVGTLGLGVQILDSRPRFTPGPIRETGKSTDFAIIDDPARGDIHGFFPVLAGDTVQLTRNGSFHQDRDGSLVDSLGNPVLIVDANGQALKQVRIYLKGSALQAIDLTTGQPAVDPVTGQPITDVERRMVVDVDVKQVKQLGNNLYDPGTAALPPSQAQLKRGFVEDSNVDLTQTMVNMMNVLRSYEANTRVVRTLDQTLQKAVNEVGKV
jgi:flagellar basal-body rod protein FlgF